MINQLIKKIQEKNSVVVVGLDPYLQQLPLSIRQAAYEKYGRTMKGASEAIWGFNQCVIDEVADLVVAVKPQIAFYELYGYEGIRVYQQTIQYAKTKGLLVIGDCKRGDIGSTSEAYALAHLGKTEIDGYHEAAFDHDFLTVNPYLGSDGLRPFIQVCEKYHKGIFVLVKTSNPSSGELQDQLLADGKPLYLKAASLIKKGTQGYHSIGCVVGAAHPKIARELRKALSHSFFLVPGYGHQGGDGKSVSVCFNEDGLGALVSASRSVLYSGNSDNWRKEIRKAVLLMNQDINQYR